MNTTSIIIILGSADCHVVYNWKKKLMLRCACLLGLAAHTMTIKVQCSGVP